MISVRANFVRLHSLHAPQRGAGDMGWQQARALFGKLLEHAFAHLSGCAWVYAKASAPVRVAALQGVME